LHCTDLRHRSKHGEQQENNNCKAVPHVWNLFIHGTTPEDLRSEFKTKFSTHTILPETPGLFFCAFLVAEI
jgi:hypothetical protein